MKLHEIQEQQKPWVLHNFGERPGWQPLLGMVEEMGELIEAYQAWNAFDTDTEVRASLEMKDAFADLAIYLCDYCSSEGYVIGTSVGHLVCSDPSWTIFNMQRLVSKIAHHHLKRHQGIRVTEDHSAEIQQSAETLVRTLDYAGGLFCFDFEQCVTETWEKVRQRDWKKNPAKGVV